MQNNFKNLEELQINTLNTEILDIFLMLICKINQIPEIYPHFLPSKFKVFTFNTIHSLQKSTQFTPPSILKYLIQHKSHTTNFRSLYLNSKLFKRQRYQSYDMLLNQINLNWFSFYCISYISGLIRNIRCWKL